MKTKLERAIEKLRDIDDWEEDSSVNIMIHNEPPPPKSSASPMPLKVLDRLPPWGRVVVIVVIVAAAVATGAAGSILLHVFGVQK